MKKKLETIGKEISVKQGDKVISGIGIDVPEEGDLIIKEKNGQTTKLSSGEVTTNLQM